MNQLKPEFLTVNSFNPWARHTSSPRGVMLYSHISQALCVSGREPRRCQTGTERKFGKYTFSIKAPCDMQVVKVIPKYRPGIGKNTINENPYSLLVYEDLNTKEIGVIELIPNSISTDVKHQHFGFVYKYKQNVMKNLVSGAIIPKDTIIADSPNVDEVGNYCLGVEAQVALMGVPGVIEDGIIVSESFLKKIQTKGLEKRIVQWGKSHYPLNLYGKGDKYKPFPDIGERVRDDGLMFSLRSYDDALAPVEMSKSALENTDYVFDKLVYGIPNAKVVDVDVYFNGDKVPATPVGMEEQVDKYYQNLKEYHKSVLEVYNSLFMKRRDNLKITPEFHRMVVESHSYLESIDNPILSKFNNKAAKRGVKKLHRRKDIDEWRVEITLEYDIVPNIGFKGTDEHASKGVICGVWKDEDMPTDIDGNRAEVIMDADSTIKRMNIGRLYEQYLNAASRDMTKRVTNMIQSDSSPSGYKKAFDYLLDYYATVSPKMAELFTGGEYKGSPEYHVNEVIKDGIYLWTPTDLDISSLEMIKAVQAKFPPTLGPVQYRGVTTSNDTLIGSMYFLLLEKTGNDWSAVSSAKLQHFGIPARITNQDKYSAPGRQQPVRMLGESEVRLLNAYVGSDTTVELIDRSNNPTTHKEIVNKILTSDTPTNIEEIVDRDKIPLGNSRNLLFVKHQLECAGVKFVREIDDPIRLMEIERK